MAAATASALSSRMFLKNPGFSDASLTPWGDQVGCNVGRRIVVCLVLSESVLLAALPLSAMQNNLQHTLNSAGMLRNARKCER